MSDEATTEVNLDINDLTLEEVERVEEHLGVPIDVAFGPGSSKAKAIRTIAWVMGQRADPEYTYEQTGTLRMSDLNMGESPAEPAG